ncbi:MAG: hypothetical protein IT555_16725 [Acetobacteraceae bacterium]|nr:hypothetical protein [Acetobacteraceae bacterium]
MQAARHVPTILQVLLWLVPMLLAVMRADAASGVPPHPPGTVCYTPRTWCWANPPGRPGTRCACPTSSGPVAGYRG